MEINVKTVAGITVIETCGDIDSSTAPTVQQRILAALQPEARVVLDMGQVGFMSSAGLRMLLYIYRQIISQRGSVVLAGLSEEIQETMSLTGFLGFFRLSSSQDAALAEV